MSYSIYIADDEKNIRDIIKSFLERDGYIVSAFENGDDLMAAFFRKPADLVVLDINDARNGRTHNMPYAARKDRCSDYHAHR